MTTDSAAPAAEAPVVSATPTAVSTPMTRTIAEYETVSIEDEGVAARSDFDFYKGRKGVTDRLGVLDLKRIGAGRSHYQEGMAYVLCRSKFTRQASEGPDGKTLYMEVMTEKSLCCELMGESSKRFAVPIIHYMTNPKGDPIKDPEKIVSFNLKVWRFGAEKFTNLQQIHNEFKDQGGLLKHDVKFSCTDDAFQKGTLVSCAEAIVAHAKFQALHGAALKSWIDVVVGELKRAIGREMTDAELRKKLGETSGGAAVIPPEAGVVSDLDKLLS